MDYYQIGQRIRKARKACGLSQEELAEKIDISTTHMSHIETGNTKLSLPVLVRVARVLGVRTDDLLNGETRGTASAVREEISEVLDRCTDQESRVIAEVVRSVKRSMDKYLCLALLLVGFLALCAVVPEVRAEEMPESEGSYYDPEDDKLTHLELLEKLCTGFPYVGYEKYPEPPVYIQQDYPHVRFGGNGGRVSTNGCGITTASMLATYMLDEKHDPEDMAGRFQAYGSRSGTEYVLFDDMGPAMGFPFIKRTGNRNEAFEALREGHMVVSLQRQGPFTTIYHFILLTGFTEDGKIMIKDANRINYESRFVNTDYFENGFPVEVVTQADYLYWIYGKKVVRYPGCSRCADPEVETAPICEEPHYCEKCTALLNQQSTYHEIMDAVRAKPEI